MVQLDSPSKSSLCEQTKLCNYELIKLNTTASASFHIHKIFVKYLFGFEQHAGVQEINMLLLLVFQSWWHDLGELKSLTL